MRFGWWASLAGVLAMILALGTAARPAPRPYRIGVLNEAWAANHPTVEGLKNGLRDLGLVEGRDIAFDIRFTEGNLDVMPATAKALVHAGVDLIFTSQHAATQAARDTTTAIPIVFTLVGDPVAARFVANLRRPEGNITGVTSRHAALVAKRMEVLKTLVPGLRRVWVIHDGTDPGASSTVIKALEAGQRLGLEVVPTGVGDRDALTPALRGVRRGDALLAPETSNLDIPAALLKTSLAKRVPAAFTTALWVGHGGLVSYGPDYYLHGVQAAAMVAKIVRGARPQDVPVEGADKIDLAVNLKTAEQFGLTVPPKVLLRADAFRR
jgi:putative ABC transport system substrate-binding protein